MSDPSDPYREPAPPAAAGAAGVQEGPAPAEAPVEDVTTGDREDATTGDREDATTGDREDATTGHPAVDAALRAVRQVAGAPPADQIPTYQAAHRTLRETLSSIDEG